MVLKLWRFSYSRFFALFWYIFGYRSLITCYCEKLIIWHERTSKSLPEYFFCKSVYKVKKIFFGQFHLFSLDFLSKSGQDGASMASSNSLGSIINYLLRNEKKILQWFISHKSILNEITCVQSCIWSTIAPTRLVRRNTIANDEPSK